MTLHFADFYHFVLAITNYKTVTCSTSALKNCIFTYQCWCVYGSIYWSICTFYNRLLHANSCICVNTCVFEGIQTRHSFIENISSSKCYTNLWSCFSRCCFWSSSGIISHQIFSELLKYVGSYSTLQSW